ncbi:MAG: hypothetical protein JWN86_2022 [Planctomycetota bacterium]|nr:hypothetical protein [Planctomycetota bacterium]
MERGDVSAVVVACGVVVAAVAIVVSVIVPLILGLFERRP